MLISIHTGPNVVQTELDAVLLEEVDLVQQLLLGDGGVRGFFGNLHHQLDGIDALLRR